MLYAVIPITASQTGPIVFAVQLMSAAFSTVSVLLLIPFYMYISYVAQPPSSISTVTFIHCVICHRTDHSLFQTAFSTECDLVLPISIYSTF